jgi:hypothetical protein
VPDKYLSIIQKINEGDAEAFDELSNQDLNTEITIKHVFSFSSENINPGKINYCTFMEAAKLIHAIAESGNDQVIDKLVSRNIDLNQSTVYNSSLNDIKPMDGTVLHYLLMAHHRFDNPSAAIEKLVDAGAMVNIKNSSGYSFVDLLQNDYNDTDLYKKIMPYLEENGLTNLESITYEEYLAAHPELNFTEENLIEPQTEAITTEENITNENHHDGWLPNWLSDWIWG